MRDQHRTQTCHPRLVSSGAEELRGVASLRARKGSIDASHETQKGEFIHGARKVSRHPLPLWYGLLALAVVLICFFEEIEE
jgi:hypothetical protein